MKKSLLALAALTAFAGAASAQSSVTVAGIVDVAARNVNNDGKTLKTLSPEGLQSNRLIIRGVEDIGGGLRAQFHLEGALSPDSGGGSSGGAPGASGGGQTWQRQATVSLVGNFGEIRLGRDYTPTFWTHTIFDPFNTVGVASQTNLMTSGNTGPAGTFLNSSATTLVRANNTVGYFLPRNLGGLYGQVQVAAGEGVQGNKYVGARVGYAAGPVNVALAFGKTYKDGTMLDDVTGVNFGGSYDLGVAKFFGQYHTYKYNGTTLKNAMAGVTAPFGASTFKFTFGKTGSYRSATQIGLGYQYDLSKRTAVYSNFGRVSNKTGSNFTASGSGVALPATGVTSTGFEVGVRHAF
jgi:predicted porin